MNSGAEGSPSPRGVAGSLWLISGAMGCGFTRTWVRLEQEVPEESLEARLVATGVWPGPGTFGPVAGR